MSNPTVSKKKLKKLLEKIDKDYKLWEAAGENPEAFSRLVVKHAETYMLTQNSSTQEELDQILEKYHWAYPLFSRMNDLIDKKL